MREPWRSHTIVGIPLTDIIVGSLIDTARNAVPSSHKVGASLRALDGS